MAGHLSQSISSSTHRDAPQSAGFVLDDLHCKALPVERIPADAVASRRGAEGARRRAGWEGSKGKKGSLALDRLLYSAQVVPRPSFVLPARRAFTYIFEASSPFLPIPSVSLYPTTLPLIRYFVSCSLSPRVGRSPRSQEVENFSVYISCLFTFFPTILSRTCT